MEGDKIYLQPIGTVINTINDIVELQKGKLTRSDSAKGIIDFLVEMYDFTWELCFTVTDIGKNRCNVQIAIEGNTRSRDRLILREFALLDSMLVAGAQIELKDKADELFMD